MTDVTDFALAREASERANERADTLFPFVPSLCPACNEPAVDCLLGSDWYLPEHLDDEVVNHRAAFGFSPSDIASNDDPSDLYDAVHVAAETALRDGEPVAELTAYLHDYDAEGYRAWERELETITQRERRAMQNHSLGEYVAE